MTEFTQKQLDEMEEIFAFIDQDHDGIITVQEFMKTLDILGLEFDDFEKTNLLDKVKANKMETLKLPEFVYLIYMIRKDLALTREIKQIFDIFDSDGNGFISSDEVEEVMRKFGEKASKKEIKKMIKEVDVDGDGTISFDEFFKMIVNSSFYEQGTK